MKKINGFFKEFRFLSNFWICEVEYMGEVFPSVEHAYQSAKTLIQEEKEWFKKANKPIDAKRLGSRITLRDDWDDVKLEIMETLVRRKFQNNEDLKLALLATSGFELEETNTWGDVFWGVCNGVGENHLGKILMKIRNEYEKTSLH